MCLCTLWICVCLSLCYRFCWCPITSMLTCGGNITWAKACTWRGKMVERQHWCLSSLGFKTKGENCWTHTGLHLFLWGFLLLLTSPLLLLLLLPLYPFCVLSFSSRGCILTWTKASVKIFSAGTAWRTGGHGWDAIVPWSVLKNEKRKKKKKI